MSPMLLNSTQGAPERRAYRVCLAMIVKNEAAIIARCLSSVFDILDSWVIVDTGSSDNTKEIIQEFMKDKPGVLLESEWKDFSTARNEAFNVASSMNCDYVMVIDADEVLNNLDKRALDFAICQHEADVYLVDVISQERVSPRVFLVKSNYQGRWVGVIHEDLQFKGEWIKLGETFIDSLDDGARNKDQNRVNNDLKALFYAIQNEPKNPRNYYYLGATYYCAGDYEQAKTAFMMRVKMAGDEREIKLSYDYLRKIKERERNECKIG